MKLRNKKTGEIVDPFGITCINGRTFVQFDDGKGTFKFEARSLAELNEEWEDYQEPKGYWYINCYGEVLHAFYNGNEWNERRKQIGNYFETKEEAERAVEKLKAWKRLKDKGFRFGGWNRRYCDEINYQLDTAEDMSKDLDLLFGGEE